LVEVTNMALPTDVGNPSSRTVHDGTINTDGANRKAAINPTFFSSFFSYRSYPRQEEEEPMEIPLSSQVIGIVLDLVLTVAAWQRGWHKTALLPVALAYPLGFLVEFATVVSDGTVASVFPLLVILGYAKTGSLVWLIIHPRRSPQVVSQPVT